MDRTIALLAGRQDGVAAHAQLVGLGLSAREISVRLQLGRLHEVHREVYAVGHRALSRRGVETAAVLACGPRAALSHRSAGEVWRLSRYSGLPHVTAPRTREPRSGIVVHTSRRLIEDDVTTADGLRITNWARTVVDLADLLDTPRIVRVLEAAVIERLYDEDTFVELLARTPGRRGARRLRAAIAAGHHRVPQKTRSTLEEAFLSVIRRADPPLPAPAMNAWLVLGNATAFEIDALWRPERVAIELDGDRYHRHVGARLRDGARDQALTDAGYVVRRFVWADVTRQPEAMTATLRALLTPDRQGGGPFRRRMR